MTPAGNMVVVEGTTRARWSRRANGSWKLAGIWPDADERQLVQGHLAEGFGLLIVVDPVPSVLSAFRDELDDPLLFSGTAPEDFLVDVTVPFLDWLPPRYADPARSFQNQVREQVADLPALLLPPFILSERSDVDGQVRFVARTPGSIHASVSDEHMCGLADYVFGSGGGGQAVTARRPGSTAWLGRLARAIATGQKETFGAGMGAGHAL